MDNIWGNEPFKKRMALGAAASGTDSRFPFPIFTAEHVQRWSRPLVNEMRRTLEKGETGEAMRVFRIAFGLDSGATPMIRENLRLALAKMENPSYTPSNNHNFDLVRRGPGSYRLLSTP